MNFFYFHFIYAELEDELRHGNTKNQEVDKKNQYTIDNIKNEEMIESIYVVTNESNVCCETFESRTSYNGDANINITINLSLDHHCPKLEILTYFLIFLYTFVGLFLVMYLCLIFENARVIVISLLLYGIYIYVFIYTNEFNIIKN